MLERDVTKAKSQFCFLPLTGGKRKCRVLLCIYIPNISLIVSWRFTILLLDEIERQLVKAPLAAAITP